MVLLWCSDRVSHLLTTLDDSWRGIPQGKLSHWYFFGLARSKVAAVQETALGRSYPGGEATRPAAGGPSSSCRRCRSSPVAPKSKLSWRRRVGCFKRRAIGRVGAFGSRHGKVAGRVRGDAIHHGGAPTFQLPREPWIMQKRSIHANRMQECLAAETRSPNVCGWSEDLAIRSMLDDNSSTFPGSGARGDLLSAVL